MGLQGTGQHWINLGGKILRTLHQSSSSAAFSLGSPVGEGVGLAKFAHETTWTISEEIFNIFLNMRGIDYDMGFYLWVFASKV